MALAETTLAAAVGITDREITVASATSIVPGRIFEVDGEKMVAQKGYVAASVLVPVLRGWDGTAQVAHLNTARVVHGDAADYGNPGAGAVAPSAPGGRVRRVRSYRTAASMDLPAVGEDLLVRLDSTAFTLTVPVPTLELDGCRVTFIGSAGAAYVLEFSGGLGGASTSYETVTFNATGAVFYEVIAMNQLWCPTFGAAFSSGTSTNISGTIG